MPQLDPLRARISLEGGAEAARSLRNLSSAVLASRNAFLAAGAAAGALGAAILGKSIKEAIKFQSAMTGVEKTVNASADTIAALGRAFQDMSTRIPVSTNELARIGEIAGQLGISVGNMESFVEVMAKLGATTNLSGEQAATALARFVNVMGSSQKDFDRIGSVIVELGNNFATTEAEITELALRMSGASKVVNISEADTLGLAAAMSQVGIQAQLGGTAYQKAVKAMATAVADGGEKLEQFASVANMSGAEFAAAWEENAATAFEAFLVGLDGVAEAGGNTFQVLTDLDLRTERLQNTLLRMAGANEKVGQSLLLARKEWETNNALNAEAAKRFDDVAEKAKMVQNAIVNLFVELGKGFLPVLGDTLDTIKDVVIWMTNLARAADLTREAWKRFTEEADKADPLDRFIRAFMELDAEKGGGILERMNKAMAVWKDDGSGALGNLVDDLNEIQDIVGDERAMERFWMGWAQGLKTIEAVDAEIKQYQDTLRGMTAEQEGYAEIERYLVLLLERRAELTALVSRDTGGGNADPLGSIASAEQLGPLVDALLAAGQKAEKTAASTGLLGQALKLLTTQAGTTEGSIADLVAQIEDMTEELEDAKGAVGGSTGLGQMIGRELVDKTGRATSVTYDFGVVLRQSAKAMMEARQETRELDDTLIPLRDNANSAANTLKELTTQGLSAGESAKLGAGFVIDLVEALNILDDELSRAIGQLLLFAGAAIKAAGDIGTLRKENKDTTEATMELWAAVAGMGAALGSIAQQAIGGKAGSVVGGVISGAAQGAAFGSAVPGIGTLAGAGIGAVVGLVGGLFGGGPSEAEQYEQKARIVLTILNEQQDVLREIAAGLETDLVDAFGKLANLITSIGDKIDKGEAKRLVEQMERLGIGFSDLQKAAQAFGLDVSELLNVLINGEGDRKLAAEQLQAVAEAMAMLPDVTDDAVLALEELAEEFGLSMEQLLEKIDELGFDELAQVFEEQGVLTEDLKVQHDELKATLVEEAAAAQRAAAAIKELNDDLSRIGFESEVFDTSLADQFDLFLSELNEALREMGLAELSETLGDLNLEAQEGRDAAREAIRELVRMIGDDLPAEMRGVILALLRILDQIESEAQRAGAGAGAKTAEERDREVEAEVAKKVRVIQRQMARDYAAQTREMQDELAKFREEFSPFRDFISKPPSSELIQTAAITETQANELLSIAATNMVANQRSAWFNELTAANTAALIRIMGGDAFSDVVNQSIGREFLDVSRIQGVFV